MPGKMIYIADELDFMKHIKSAMEAENDGPEDLTASTNDAMRRVNSTTNKPSTEPTRTSEDTQQEDAASTERGNMSGDMSNITPEDPNTANTPDTGDNPAEGDDTGLDDLGGMGGEDDMGMDGGTDDMGGMSGGMGEEDQLPHATAEQGRQIVNLQTNMSAFYQKIANMLNILSNYAAPTSDPDLRDLYNNCVDHVSEIKAILEDTSNTPITSVNYPNKLRKYVALRHAYSAILEMLDIHFDVLSEQLGVVKSATGNSDTQTSK